jgi:hypothetical protein
MFYMRFFGGWFLINTGLQPGDVAALRRMSRFTGQEQEASFNPQPARCALRIVLGRKYRRKSSPES